jgi:hypothetical protein
MMISFWRRAPQVAKTARTGGTIRSERRGVKHQIGLEDGERLLQVREQVLDILDPDGNSYKTVG